MRRSSRQSSVGSPQLTGYNVCDQERGRGFQTYWQAHGLRSPELDPDARSLALLELPLTEATVEINPTDGRPYLTQWFERARMEWRPDLAEPYTVLLGLLGREQNRIFAPVQLPPQPIQYFWPRTLPSGIRILPEHSIAADHGYLLALGDAQRVSGYLSAGALAIAALPAENPPVDVSTTIRGQPGILHGVPYGQVAIWQEQGAAYSLSFNYGPLSAMPGLAGDFEIVDRATWLQRIGAPSNFHMLVPSSFCRGGFAVRNRFRCLKDTHLICCDCVNGI